VHTVSYHGGGVVHMCVHLRKPQLTDFTDNVWSVLYLGVCSSGIAYTLQILAQKDANPTVTTLLLSMESVFGVVAGAIANGEVMLAKEYIGCALMLIAVVLAQIPIAVFKKAFRKCKKTEEKEKEETKE
jgi:drug/metabolite transporter (DMT)-like permease